MPHSGESEPKQVRKELRGRVSCWVLEPSEVRRTPRRWLVRSGACEGHLHPGQPGVVCQSQSRVVRTPWRKASRGDPAPVQRDQGIHSVVVGRVPPSAEHQAGYGGAVWYGSLVPKQGKEAAKLREVRCEVSELVQDE